MTSKVFRPLLAAALAIILFLLGYTSARLLPQSQPAAPPVQKIAVVAPKPQFVSVIVDAGDDKAIISPEIAWEDKLTAFKALQKLSEQATFDLEYKNYGGDMCVFVTSIDGKLDPSKKKWWQFWVNGKYADKGASSYELKPGDSVYWKLSSQMQ